MQEKCDSKSKDGIPKAGSKWLFFSRVDTPGNDIAKFDNAAMDKLAAKCLERNGVAFNSNGWIKNKVKPRSQWFKWTKDLKKGLYVLNSEIQRLRISSQKGIPVSLSQPEMPQTPQNAKVRKTIMAGKKKKKNAASIIKQEARTFADTKGGVVRLLQKAIEDINALEKRYKEDVEGKIFEPLLDDSSFSSLPSFSESLSELEPRDGKGEGLEQNRGDGKLRVEENGLLGDVETLE